MWWKRSGIYVTGDLKKRKLKWSRISIWGNIGQAFSKSEGIKPQTEGALLLLLSHFSRVRLCDPIDSSPPGSPLPGILQARTLEWVAISLSNAWKWKVKVVSGSSQPHGLQPTRLLHPWDFPGKSTGVGCHSLIREALQLYANCKGPLMFSLPLSFQYPPLGVIYHQTPFIIWPNHSVHHQYPPPTQTSCPLFSSFFTFWICSQQRLWRQSVELADVRV